MKAFNMILVTIFTVFCISNTALSQGSINVDNPAQMKEAVDFLNASNDFDTMILTVSGGIYTTTDTMFYEVKKPMTIKAAEGLAEKPIITHSDDSSNVLEMFRIYDDLTVEGVAFDGGGDFTHGMKYALRVGNSPDETIMAKEGLNITVRNCDFRNIAEDKDYSLQGNAIYFLKDINTVGKVSFENCTFKNISDEAIRMTETEKYDTERCLDSLIVRNCTFIDNGSECVRFYADTDTSTADAYVLIEHLTVYNSSTRIGYIKNNQNAIFRDVLVTNSRISIRRPERSDYVVQVQQRGSVVSYVDTLNIVFGAVRSAEAISGTKGATEDLETVWGFDPMFEDPDNDNFTLLPGSHAYQSAHDGTALGDLRWATNTPTTHRFDVSVEGSGKIRLDPPIQGRVYDPGTLVTLTAVPDSGWIFAGWSGDITGSDTTNTVTVDAAKSITAAFEMPTAAETAEQEPKEYRLHQNYPNPFNPTTNISFSLKHAGMTSIEIYNVLGQKISTLINRSLEVGSYRLTFDASNMSSGVYFYQIVSGDFVEMKKMVLMK